MQPSLPESSSADSPVASPREPVPARLNCLGLIEAKREGSRHSPDQIRALIGTFTSGGVPDYQMAAWLMAVYFQGLDEAETCALTLAMRDSGVLLEFPADPRPLVDKHSTGGIGDKVSLPLAPLLACLGARVPMISGRGLGITGGTLDKLESIPGYLTALPPDRIVRQVQEIGCVICGQTDQMVPADKLIYALRDVTGTIPSVPLMTASILSKKLAENLRALLLDVKFGEAAFMRTPAQARILAATMVALGTQCGVKVRALLTTMNRPLGRAAGNWLEVREAVDCLEGRGPADLHELVTVSAAHLLVQSGLASTLADGQARAAACLASGQARQKWNQMLQAQGVDLDRFEAKLQAAPAAPVVRELMADQTGYVRSCRARTVGEVVRELGGGRLTKEAAIHFEVGLDQLAAPGEEVHPGGSLARIHALSVAAADKARARLQTAFEITPEPAATEPLVLEVLAGVDGPLPTTEGRRQGGMGDTRRVEDDR